MRDARFISAMCGAVVILCLFGDAAYQALVLKNPHDALVSLGLFLIAVDLVFRER